MHNNYQVLLSASDNYQGLPKLSRETKFSGANGDREISIFPVQLTTSRTDNLTRMILTLAICDDHTYEAKGSTRYWNYLENNWPFTGRRSAANAIGTRLRNLTNSGLTRWQLTALKDAKREEYQPIRLMIQPECGE